MHLQKPKYGWMTVKDAEYYIENGFFDKFISREAVHELDVSDIDQTTLLVPTKRAIRKGILPNSCFKMVSIAADSKHDKGPPPVFLVEDLDDLSCFTNTYLVSYGHFMRLSYSRTNYVLCLIEDVVTGCWNFFKRTVGPK